MKLNVHFLPELVSPSDLSESTVVMIDVLRASTTIVHALAAGATFIRPCRDVADAHRLAAAESTRPLLGGERGGEKIPGFDLGNSPLEYTREVVAGREIVFTTTNGTAALEHACEAARVLIGAFVNLSAVCEDLHGRAGVELLCAGTNRAVTREDVLFAGAVAHHLDQADGALRLNDQGELAVDAWKSAMMGVASCSLFDCLKCSSGARNLIEIGHERDIEIAANVDTYGLVPVYDVQRRVITASA